MSEPLVISLGCRLNACESAVMRQHAIAAGLQNTVFVNTCAVTAEAVRQARQTVRRLRRDRPTARLVVTGCAAQVEPEQFAALPDVDHVIGNTDKLRAETYTRLGQRGLARVHVDDIMLARQTAPPPMQGGIGRARAFVQVQNGCDHRCTFCIIPYGRGPSRSVPACEVVSAVRRRVQDGNTEIVLTGVDITSYGRDLPGEASLGRLVRRILAGVPELQRLRLSSIDQAEMDEDLLAALADEPRLMPHLHLSLQSGDDLILKRMKRRHSPADAIAFCESVRRARPDIAFGADLIVGFPTETEAMFQNTLRLVEACDLAFLHVFPFSPRRGTPAARMPQVTQRLVSERASRLRAHGTARLSHFLTSHTGRVVEAVMERGGFGRTPQFAEVSVGAAAAPREGVLAKVRVTGHDGRRLLGEVVR